ncbi:TPA: bifunctional proline dehydrogenase/L-glutamate gamma-semialdehyde dehydrogenase PutA [Neisseria meningitidis]|uniref:bifunctional proline dehydrogenase/L-glutamate gamma-semialdehyde dehydrogenase PutA n=1 Tax=Neisseria meningitidis TaxID=487 RepID=UPI0001A46DB2|nr:bifunctional proline dehydrogenase/L-glutamate gamma-semialdehyde dehydrogenase PutA [Neisseria meningitidis]MCL4976208.1 bifunctional proline dehydrogenase/L-glutamate gamma-semialdehyde dehydrogenase PutA [Neisseria meningitidis]MCL5842233.1 bifunctional proline dehydrogenase/L-glutamate gamma-semialdehyde dehydrogenase PutA [Neisseria meningitidis]MCL5844520.1 bifunctional proline dehydrogenase/L-glutamate gamma-semialdehyde dehydrogenase PutA [Neisseria meningitidis]MCL5846457.1 bifuncti
MFHFAFPAQTALRQAITDAYRRNEIEAVQDMLQRAQMSDEERNAASELARRLVTQVRAGRTKAGGVDALMHEFSLSSEEGIALMCLAEALLRIPDNATRDRLIADKISDGNWKSHLNNSPSLFVNAAAWGLLITGKLTATNDRQMSSALSRLISKGGAPLIRQGVNYAMRLLGKQFVTGQTIEEALQNGKEREKMGYRFSFDMLGEAAYTQADADRYYRDYVEAIHAIGKDAAGQGVYEGNGISVKLSAIHPRYSRAQHGRVMGELLPRLKELFLLGKKYDIGINIDAEEANRLELSLDLMEALVSDPDLAGYKGIGFVVQAYQKRCPFVIDYLIDLARRNNQKLMIRLVKGAYWDSEIKWAQVDGLNGYPTYTRKVHTDISYLACARKLLSAQDAVFPQFATHNAYTLGAIYQMGKGKDFEHQCLHGMGETLYDQVVGPQNLGRRVRVYAPVGTHETLLAYLVRRLLENGANSSFVNQIVDENISIDTLIRSPFDTIAEQGIHLHNALPLPRDLYGKCRLNSQGVDLSNENVLQQLQEQMNKAAAQDFHAASIVNGKARDVGEAQPIKNPADHDDIVGTVSFADAALAQEAVGAAVAAFPEWSATPAAERAACLRRFADLLEQHTPALMMLAVREAGKTLNNAIAEVREAVDFCRYYANEAEHTLPQDAKAVGAIVAISPWNFPLAIFTGEVVSALAAGNTVIAKPAEQTGLIAGYAVSLMHEAGILTSALQLVLGAGDVGAALTNDARIGGVIFTGSTEVARLINKALAKRGDNPVLIAETGGQNAMIVDSTALAEQVCADVLNSAFDSAGQRCSALRILCVQEDVADRMLDMIKGAMDELVVGKPIQLTTDVGPVIDAEAQQNLLNHINKMKGVAKSYHEVKTAADVDSEKSTFVRPILFELNNLNELQREVFGPVLHVVRYRADELDNVIDQINSKGYALTHGVHSRIEGTVRHIRSRIEAGNVYVNRNIVGAVVGVQPFGGHGLSGTGPKAGGSFYLQKLTRAGEWVAPTLSQIGQADEAALKRLEALVHKLPFNAEEKKAAAAALGHARIRTLRRAETVLTGPTGERNSISWHAPKRVWIHGGSTVQAFAALTELAASGVQAVVEPDSPLASYTADLEGLLLVNGKPETVGISHVAALSPLDSARKQELAAHDGALIRVLPSENGLDILQVFEEISCSVNTTAAGGNASLMAVAD